VEPDTAIAPTGLTKKQLADWDYFNHLYRHNLRANQIGEADKWRQRRDAIAPRAPVAQTPLAGAPTGFDTSIIAPSPTQLFSEAINNRQQAPPAGGGGSSSSTSVANKPPEWVAPTARENLSYLIQQPQLVPSDRRAAATARDGQSIWGQKYETRKLFLDTYGEDFERVWKEQHEAGLPPTPTPIATTATETAQTPGGETAEQREARERRQNAESRARAASGGPPPVVDAPVHTGSPTPYAPSSVGGQEQEAFNAAIEEIATKLATTEDEMRKTQAVMVGLDQARIDTEQQQAAAAQQLQALDILSDPRTSFFEQFSRAPRGTPIQIGPELSAVMRGQTIPAYGEIRHYTPGQPQLETIANDPESIRRAFEGAVGRLTTESIQNLSPRAIDQLSVLGQIGGYFPTDVFRAREAAIPKQPRLVRSLQLG